MIRHGEPPYLECSSRGDRRFSALFARIFMRDLRTIEDLYQSYKTFPPGPGVGDDGHMLKWRDAKGKTALNQVECAVFYDTLWDEYINENPYLLEVLIAASGLSDMFGQPGSACQATSLWRIRNAILADKTKDVS